MWGKFLAFRCRSSRVVHNAFLVNWPIRRVINHFEARVSCHGISATRPSFCQQFKAIRRMSHNGSNVYSKYLFNFAGTRWMSVEWHTKNSWKFFHIKKQTRTQIPGLDVTSKPKLGRYPRKIFSFRRRRRKKNSSVSVYTTIDASHVSKIFMR